MTIRTERVRDGRQVGGGFRLSAVWQAPGREGSQGLDLSCSRGCLHVWSHPSSLLTFQTQSLFPRVPGGHCSGPVTVMKPGCEPEMLWMGRAGACWLSPRTEQHRCQTEGWRRGVLEREAQRWLGGLGRHRWVLPPCSRTLCYCCHRQGSPRFFPQPPTLPSIS